MSDNCSLKRAVVRLCLVVQHCLLQLLRNLLFIIEINGKFPTVHLHLFMEKFFFFFSWSKRRKKCEGDKMKIEFLSIK